MFFVKLAVFDEFYTIAFRANAGMNLKSAALNLFIGNCGCVDSFELLIFW
jgi:hypothetical protein